MPFEHFSSPWLFFLRKAICMCCDRLAGRVFALRPVLFIELKVMGHRDDEKTLKLEDQVLCRAKLASWQNLTSWSSSSCFWRVATLGRLSFLSHQPSRDVGATVTYTEPPCHWHGCTGSTRGLEQAALLWSSSAEHGKTPPNLAKWWHNVLGYSKDPDTIT